MRKWSYGREKRARKCGAVWRAWNLVVSLCRVVSYYNTPSVSFIQCTQCNLLCLQSVWSFRSSVRYCLPEKYWTIRIPFYSLGTVPVNPVLMSIIRIAKHFDCLMGSGDRLILLGTTVFSLVFMSKPTHISADRCMWRGWDLVGTFALPLACKKRISSLCTSVWDISRGVTL